MALNIKFLGNPNANMFGLGHYGDPTVKAIKDRLIVVGIPTSIVSGALTTLTFAGAFKLAGTERVWSPALVVGGAVALISMLKLAHCASNVGSVDTVAISAGMPAVVVSPSPTAASTPVVYPDDSAPVASDDGYDDGSADYGFGGLRRHHGHRAYGLGYAYTM